VRVVLLGDPLDLVDLLVDLLTLQVVELGLVTLECAEHVVVGPASLYTTRAYVRCVKTWTRCVRCMCVKTWGQGVSGVCV
jgi:hypothetical protein